MNALFRPFRRRPKLTAAVAWLIITSCCWWLIAPAGAITTIPLGRQYLFAGTTTGGDLVTRDYGREHPYQWPWHGPVQVWSSETGRLKHAFLGADDVIMTSPDEVDAVAVFRGSTISIVDLTTGKARFRRHVESDRPIVAFSADGERVALVDGLILRMLNARTGHQLWSKNFPELLSIAGAQRYPGPTTETLTVTPSFRALTHVVLQSGGGLHSLWLETATGEPRRFLPLELDGRASPDGRRILAIPGFSQPNRLHDAETGRLIRTFAKDESPLGFSRDSKEVVTYRPDGLSRWSVEDGRRLDDSSDLSSGWGVSNKEESRAVTISYHFDQSAWRNWIPTALRQRVEDMFPAGHRQAQIIDLATGRQRRVKRVRHGLEIDGAFEPLDLFTISGGARFGVVTLENVAVYDFSLAPDWAWLVKWGLGPIALVAAFLQVAKIRQQRRNARQRFADSDAITSPPPLPALPSASS